jgi:hypothetical protein
MERSFEIGSPKKRVKTRFSFIGTVELLPEAYGCHRKPLPDYLKFLHDAPRSQNNRNCENVQMTTRAYLEKGSSTLRWFPAYIQQRFLRRRSDARPVHLIIALADHFEPAIRPDSPGAYADGAEQLRRLDNWCSKYPAAVQSRSDDDGQPFRHTYFYPAEQYDPVLIDRLAAHCREGWGEIEIQLHHGVHSPDSAENTQRTIADFRDALAARGCLSHLKGDSAPRYAFVHGNWALANSAQGRFCGVDSEMQILADTGCYADFTLPSAPSTAQIRKINSLYECAAPLGEAVPHRTGKDLRCGSQPKTFPLIIQGPLMLNFARKKRGWPSPGIENGEITGANPATTRRLELWQDAAIGVRGRPEWLFIKLHCHGMDPRDEQAMLGPQAQQFLSELLAPELRDKYRVHFVTAREMVNIALAACDGKNGNPGDYRDYRLILNHATGASLPLPSTNQNRFENSLQLEASQSE